MSRLKELRLHGFKSFADPTRFVFEPGVNAVLGPNGSGKSNMADAVRWVLGEQSNRSLRTRRADDVIFAGSEQRRPQGMAEAILTLDNADGWLPIDFAEVSIGRRAYRSGETEYLVNGARARLRDVVDLLGEGRLGANELVVVGQGTVDAALSLRPEERRQLFEEAAGVKALQVKRNGASSRLAKALDNLTRVSDLVAELKPQVRRLALQAEHQQQHDALGSRARALVVASHRRREQAARAQLGDARRSAAAAEAALESYRTSQEAARREISEAEASYWEADDVARGAARDRETTREALIRAEGRLEAADARLAELRGQLERDTAALAESEAAPAADEGSTASAAMASALGESTAAEGAWRAALAALASADEQLLAAEEAVAELRSRDSDRIAAAARSAEEIARRSSRHDQAIAERDDVERELVEARALAGGADERLRSALSAVGAAAKALDAAEAGRDDAQQAADAARQRVVELAENLRAARAELETVSGPADAASRLGRRLTAAGWPSLLDAMQAPESAWAAIEAVVGGELEGALLWSDGDPTDQLDGARGSARLLAAGEGDDDAGRAQALDAVAGSRTLDEWLGIDAAPTVFRHAVLARDLHALLDGWRRLPAGWIAVTSEGDLADVRGMLVLRGRADPPGGATARAHARRRELLSVVARLEAESLAAQRAGHDATERLRLTRDAHLAARDASDEADRQVRAAREAQEVAGVAVRRLEQRATGLAREIEAVAPGERDDAVPAPEADQLASLQSVAYEARAARDALAAGRDEARERWTRAREAAEGAERLTVGQRRDRAAREALVAQLRASVGSVTAAIGDLAGQRETLAASLAAASSAEDDSSARLQAAEQSRTASRARARELEGGQGTAGSRLAELERSAQSTAVEVSRRDETLAALGRERELALEGIAPAEEVEVPTDVEALDDEALEAELRRVRRLLSQIGSVNPFAVEEHREVADRLGEMSSQEQDLRAAIGSTEELIARLDAEIATQFDAAFHAIGERFDEFCQLLFAGGSGSLAMADEADGDAPGGIEIVVRPPGKRLQRLGMLSGGERALTGVALLFAMLTVNPVPFCILDEVDAALDEANIGRFAQALRRLSESIDFVVITHNRATIEVADTIYGVTMTDAAVSRVLSLRLADLPAEVPV